MDKKELGRIKINDKREAIFFDNGCYQILEDGQGIIGGHIDSYQVIVSTQLNNFKAKLFNVIEASMTDEKQQEAIKGLIKGFSTECYYSIIKDIKSDFELWGLIEKNSPIAGSVGIDS